MRHHIVMYSGGIGSWAAAKRVIDKYGVDDVILLFTDTMMEDEDLYRFMVEGYEKLGYPQLVWLCDGRDPWQVFHDVRWLGNSRLAQCSHILKQKKSRQWVEQHFKPEEVTLYIGIDWTETHRLKAVVENWSPYTIKAPMCEEPYLDKNDMLQLLQHYQIEVPRLYKMGFSHNNCGGFCVRGGQGHFANLLKKMPERYLYHEAKEQEMREFLGADVSILSKSEFSHYEFIEIESDGQQELFETETINGKTYEKVARYKKTPFTLKQLREQIETEPEQIDLFDIGGCGCFAQYDSHSN